VNESAEFGSLVFEVVKQFLSIGGAIVTALVVNRAFERGQARKAEIARIRILIMDIGTRRTLDNELQKLGQLNENPTLDAEWSKRSVFALRDMVRDARENLLPNSPFAEPLTRMTTFCNDWLEQFEWPGSDFKELLAELSNNIYGQIQIITAIDKRIDAVHPGRNSLSDEVRARAESLATKLGTRR
jgi:hypothetical protein